MSTGEVRHHTGNIGDHSERRLQTLQRLPRGFWSRIDGVNREVCHVNSLRLLLMLISCYGHRSLHFRAL